MALNRVNLLPVSVVESALVNRRVMLVRSIVQIVLVAFITIIIGFFSWFFIVNQQIKVWSQRRLLVMDQLEGLKESESLYRRFGVIISMSDKIMAERKDFRVMLQEIYSRLSTDSFVSDLRFLDSGVLLQLRAVNVHAFTNSVESFSRIGQGDSKFGDVILKSVSRDLDGQYLYDLELQMMTQSDGKK